MLGELLIPAAQQPNYPYGKNTEIIGLTKRGKRLYKSVKDDGLWNEAYRRSEFIGGVSFEVMASCCDYIRNNLSSMNTWHPTKL